MTEPLDLPKLPEPDGYMAMTHEGSFLVPPNEVRAHNCYAIFTAEQMRDYARAAVLADRASRWMPIESAPKDGRRVMLTIKGYTSLRGPFAHPDSDAEIMHLARWTGDFWEPYIPNSWTHWRELPAPPSEPQTQTSVHFPLGGGEVVQEDAPL